MSTGTSGSPWLPYSIAFIAVSLTAVLSRSSRAGASPRSATAAATRSMARRSLPSSPGIENAVTSGERGVGVTGVLASPRPRLGGG